MILGKSGLTTAPARVGGFCPVVAFWFTNVASADVIVLPWQILNVIILEMLQYSSQSGLDLLLLPVA
ncbi:hypothetical protein V6N12_042399 [Hibiscus sabdariffa]|uniref:Uncharacterized protein n=1 Tax=Hibiscus sabdariffa TaxID=183260 RepID=A0ABR2EEN6_9ROSI